jgi:L-ascorbate metabolism protein UlaG (beta-lactamase superfamily)
MMQLTKYAQACVTLEKHGATIVLDPGVYSPNADTLLAGAAAALITHEHGDHFDEAALRTALETDAALLVFGPSSVVDRLGAFDGRVTAVGGGDAFEVAGFAVQVFGDTHAPIHGDVPTVENVGYLVDDVLLHPGDALVIPGVPVETLLVPTSGPWWKLGETADWMREIAPRRAFAIHELLASELGLKSTAAMLGRKGLTGVPLTTLATGQAITV